MRQVLVAVLVLHLMATASADLVSGQAASDDGCAGSWLVHVTIEGRELVEDWLVAFNVDGTVIVYGPPVQPALPGSGEIPLYASAGLGTWQSTEERACAFEVVRLLATDDGTGVGTLNVRATAAVDADDRGIEGGLTYTRSTAFGQMEASGSGTFTGTRIDGPLLWLTPTAEEAPHPASTMASNANQAPSTSCAPESPPPDDDFVSGGLGLTCEEMIVMYGPGEAGQSSLFWEVGGIVVHRMDDTDGLVLDFGNDSWRQEGWFADETAAIHAFLPADSEYAGSFDFRPTTLYPEQSATLYRSASLAERWQRLGKSHSGDILVITSYQQNGLARGDVVRVEIYAAELRG